MATYINRRAYDFASIRISMLGNDFVIGCSAISYTAKQEKTNNYGQGGKPVSRSRGKVEYDGSITLDQAEIRAILGAAGVDSLTRVQPFNLIVSFSEGAEPVITDTLEYTEFTEDGFTAGVDNNATTVEIPLIIGNIVKGGI